MKNFSTLLVLGMFVLGFGMTQTMVNAATPTQQKVVHKEGLKQGLKNGNKAGNKAGLKYGLKDGLKNGLKDGAKNGPVNGAKK